MARKNAAHPCAESDGPEIWWHDGTERSRTRLPSAQTAPPGCGSRALHPSKVLRFYSNLANSFRATCQRAPVYRLRYVNTTVARSVGKPVQRSLRSQTVA